MRDPLFLVLLRLLTLNLLVSAVDGDDGWVPDKFRRIYDHASIVADDTLYILGGELHLQDDGAPDGFHTTAMDSTLSISLQNSWTNASVDIKAQHYPENFPYMNAQNLWWDPKSDSIWAYGGATTTAGDEGTEEIDPLSVWVLENDTWDERYGPDDKLWDTMTRATRCASAYSPETGYCLGGYSGQSSTPIDTPGWNLPIGGMVELDFESTSWSNASSVGSSQRGWTINQEMEYIPSYGEEGILVAVGGDDISTQGWYMTGTNLRSMSNITIYDIHTKTWHSQTASGDVPEGRSEFCSVSAQGGDNDTYEIFAFGGTTGHWDSTNDDSSQVYVLSLPAFRWFRTPVETEPRFMHTCEVVGGRQMLSIGGSNAIEQHTIDSFKYGLGIFDMVDWEWKPSYDADAAPYEPADTIKEFYSNADSQYPAWDSENVKSLFERSLGTESAPSNPDTTATSSGSEPVDTSSSDDSLPVAAIAGGVVGGVGGVAVIGVFLFFLFGRRKKSSAYNNNGPKELDAFGSNGKPEELGADYYHPVLKENNHPRDWKGRVNELEGRGQEGRGPRELNELDGHEYHRGQRVWAPRRGPAELES
ncbi:hypothetical protein FQN54_001309 [Arachnomyces sp. PD_36]|nr:hypothetical protein FQN54_001309 [Arachnomyces sp. PD_36]